MPGTGTRVSGPEPLPEYPVNVAIPTGKVWEFDVVWKVVTLTSADVF